MAHRQCISRLGGWEGYEVVEDWDEDRGRQRWYVIRLTAVAGIARQCSACGEMTTAIHDLQERRVRDLPIFEHPVELIVPQAQT